jgi:molybdopterin-guanine dinucleotide biosynthesis protein A
LSAISIVLAGGRGLRLGRYKASVEINGQNLLQRVVSRLAFLGGEIIVVIAEGQPPPSLTGYPKLRVVTDIYPNKGPLVGVYTGLLNSDSAYNLVVACDMPFLNRRLLGYMLEVSAGYDVAVPRLGEMVEPLHAVYSKQCLDVIKQLLDQDSLKIDRLLERVKVRYVETGEIDSFDPEHLSFFNINNKKDLETARELVERVV